MKRIYGMLEKQFKLTFFKAERLKGITGENLLILLERRLDSIVYRMHFASSRNQARQLVSHGLVKVNGRRVNIASFIVKQGDEIELKEKAKKMTVVKESLNSRAGATPSLQVDPDTVWGMVTTIPRRNDITDLQDINEQLIVELYSK
ncbi:30S ribosomal protein S4 [subsurface metagenome]